MKTRISKHFTGTYIVETNTPKYVYTTLKTYNGDVVTSRDTIVKQTDDAIVSSPDGNRYNHGKTRRLGRSKVLTLHVAGMAFIGGDFKKKLLANLTERLESM